MLRIFKVENEIFRFSLQPLQLHLLMLALLPPLLLFGHPLGVCAELERHLQSCHPWNHLLFLVNRFEHEKVGPIAVSTSTKAAEAATAWLHGKEGGRDRFGLLRSRYEAQQRKVVYVASARVGTRLRPLRWLTAQRPVGIAPFKTRQRQAPGGGSPPFPHQIVFFFFFFSPSSSFFPAHGVTRSLERQLAGAQDNQGQQRAEEACGGVQVIPTCRVMPNDPSSSKCINPPGSQKARYEEKCIHIYPTQIL
mmetsp:Transcript_14779/g.30378  ORF Transcript_14779/g.30378 Transcript_14779/m.30378 type:complete len:250 (-) Transcript_14779:75-824(-)